MELLLSLLVGFTAGLLVLAVSSGLKQEERVQERLGELPEKPGPTDDEEEGRG